jgi:S-adenosylmethionine:tRNA ribosyltransferase-isomerase
MNRGDGFAYDQNWIEHLFRQGSEKVHGVQAMDTDLFDYPLPPERIAQQPAAPRDSARLLVVERATKKIGHHIFQDLPQLLPPGTRLFRNHAAVFKARLHLTRPTGGQLECLLLNPDLARDASGNTWWCLLKPGRKYPPGAKFGVEGLFTATLLEKLPDGRCLARFDVSPSGGVPAVAEKLGETPLPPYIRREGPDAAPQRARDADNYQTVYADPAKKIAAAAPTAGLHFTPNVLAELEKRGVATHNLALRVGLDTFRPIAAARLEDHTIHREWYEIPADTRTALAAPGGPRLAVGTTTLRAMEDYYVKSGESNNAAPPLDQPWLAEADIFIFPPRVFTGTEILLTNFHLPRSTLLCLVSAFLTPGSTAGIAWLKEIYAEAIAREYRFYSYGDAMLIL